MIDILYREFVYISYYFEIQLRQILIWYLFGIIVGSVISVFMKGSIIRAMEKIGIYEKERIERNIKLFK